VGREGVKSLEASSILLRAGWLAFIGDGCPNRSNDRSIETMSHVGPTVAPAFSCSGRLQRRPPWPAAARPWQGSGAESDAEAGRRLMRGKAVRTTSKPSGWNTLADGRTRRGGASELPS
jgi:hypothetical protein